MDPLSLRPPLEAPASAQLNAQFNAQELENQFDECPMEAGKSPVLVPFREPTPQDTNAVGSDAANVMRSSKGTSNRSETAQLKEKQSPTRFRVGLLEKKKEQFSSIEGSANLLEVEFRIKEIAKSIRQRVKRHSPEPNCQNTRVKSIEQPQKLRLSPINRINADLTLPSPSKLLTFEEPTGGTTIDSEQMVRELVRKDILDKAWQHIELEEKLKRNKLKLDPIRHKYPITTFRRAVLEEERQATLHEEERLRERQQKLLQRRIIYNTSRYDRYIQGKKQTNANQPMVESLVLLKQPEPFSTDSLENPETTNNLPNQTFFPTQMEQPPQKQDPQPNIQMADEAEQEGEYGEDFL